MAPSNAPNRIGASRSVTLTSSTAPSPRQSSRQEQPTAARGSEARKLSWTGARRPSEAILAPLRARRGVLLPGHGRGLTGALEERSGEDGAAPMGLYRG